MHPSTSAGVTGFWYAGQPDQESGRAVLNALRDYRLAEQDLRRRTRDKFGINEKDMQALRYLMRAHHQRDSLGPTDLSRLLGISTASTTALIDRLVSSGHLERRRHPTDRRALELIPTKKSNIEMREVLEPMHNRMMDVAAALSPDEAQIIAGFLQRLTDIVDEKPATSPELDATAEPS